MIGFLGGLLAVLNMIGASIAARGGDIAETIFHCTFIGVGIWALEKEKENRKDDT